MTMTLETVKPTDSLAVRLDQYNDALLTCVHCGLCLPSCPTYRQLGNENDSPRGRIYLMRSLAEGHLAMGDAFASHIDLCLGCRACETACPSGVPYGHLLEAARVQVAESPSRRRSGAELVVRLLLNQVFARTWLLRMVMAMARWVRDSGLAQLAFDDVGLSGRLRFALALLLATRTPPVQTENRATDASDNGQPIKHQVALLRGCVMEGLFAETNRATERVLARIGCETIETNGHVCCGALPAHAGQLETAKALARQNIAAFLSSGCEHLIVNSAGCGAAMKEYKELLADDSEWAERAAEVSAKVRDVSEFLAEIGIAAPGKELRRCVAYDAPCHLLHAQKIADAPFVLLRQIPGLTLVPLVGSEVCCGGAGIYNLQHEELSQKILSDKITNIKACAVDTVVTANPGCLMQIGAGLRLAGLEVDVIHPIELLDAAYQGEV